MRLPIIRCVMVWRSVFFFFSSRRRHTRFDCDWSSDVCSSDLVLRRAGLQVERAEVMHLNRECRYPDLSNLFVREDVTALVESVLIGVPDELEIGRASCRERV